MYFWQALAEDETSQRLGTVMLLFFHIMDGTVIPDAEMRNMLVRIMDACPIHSSAVHYCLPNTPFCHALKTAYLLVIGKRFRSRSRFHVGATTECFYSLKGFGIPVHQIPNNLDFSTREKKKNHIKWVSFRQAKDRLTETNPSLVEDIVECPQPEDYLYGKVCDGCDPSFLIKLVPTCSRSLYLPFTTGSSCDETSRESCHEKHAERTPRSLGRCCLQG